MKRFFAALSIAICAVSTWAAPKTVTLSVPTMDCPVCPITVKKALLKVAGVSHASVDFDKRQAMVRFDDAKTSIETLTLSTKDAGYPSTLATSTLVTITK